MLIKFIPIISKIDQDVYPQGIICWSYCPWLLDHGRVLQKRLHIRLNLWFIIISWYHTINVKLKG